VCGCGRPSEIADHVPPLALVGGRAGWEHLRSEGKAYLRGQCKACSQRQAAQVRKIMNARRRLAREGLAGRPVDLPPTKPKPRITYL
jgi:hypothetical protein